MTALNVVAGLARAGDGEAHLAHEGLYFCYTHGSVFPGLLPEFTCHGFQLFRCFIPDLYHEAPIYTAISC